MTLIIHSSICTVLWSYKQEKGYYVVQRPNCHAALKILLLLAGDIETCPGPTKCNNCSKIIRRNQTSTTCFDFKEELHLRCAIDEIKDGYERLYCKDCVYADKIPQDQSDIIRHMVNDINVFLKKRGLKIFHQI